MVEEFVLLGRCAMPGYFQLRPTPLPGGAADDRRQSGSMKRGGVGACFKVCQQPWTLEDRAGRRAERAFPARQLSRLADVPAYVAAGVAVLKLQGRSLPAETLGALVGAVPPRRSTPAAAGRPADARPRARAARDLDRGGPIGGAGVTPSAFELTTADLEPPRPPRVGPQPLRCRLPRQPLLRRATRGTSSSGPPRSGTPCARFATRAAAPTSRRTRRPAARDVDRLRRALEAAAARRGRWPPRCTAPAGASRARRVPGAPAPPRVLRERVYRRRARPCTGRSAPPGSRRPPSCPSTRCARSPGPAGPRRGHGPRQAAARCLGFCLLLGCEAELGVGLPRPLPAGRVPLAGRLGPEVRRHRGPERARRVSPRAPSAPAGGRAPALPRRGPLGDACLPAPGGPGVSGGPRRAALGGDAALDARLVGAPAGALARGVLQRVRVRPERPRVRRRRLRPGRCRGGPRGQRWPSRQEGDAR